MAGANKARPTRKGKKPEKVEKVVSADRKSWVAAYGQRDSLNKAKRGMKGRKPHGKRHLTREQLDKQKSAADSRRLEKVEMKTGLTMSPMSRAFQSALGAKSERGLKEALCSYMDSIQ